MRGVCAYHLVQNLPPVDAAGAAAATAASVGATLTGELACTSLAGCPAAGVNESVVEAPWKPLGRKFYEDRDHRKSRGEREQAASRRNKQPTDLVPAHLRSTCILTLS